MTHFKIFLRPNRMLLFLFLLVSGFFLWTPSGRSACFTDPLMQGQDPQVEFQNGIFYLVQSDGCNIHLRQSTTLGGLVTAANPIILSPGCLNVWAPEIHWLGNKWYLYYSLAPDAAGANHRVYVAQSEGTNAAGPYTILGVLFDHYWNIDGSVFTGINGQLYFIFSGSPSGTQNIYIAPMSNPYTLSGPPVMISQPTQSWEINGAPPAVNEGPFGLTRNGRTFIVYSASGCWTDDYCLGLLTLTGPDPLEPSAWSKSGPVFTQRAGAYGPGHNCVLMDGSGQWWNVYHANNLSGQGCGGYRQIRIQRLDWTAGGLPVFGAPVPLGSWISDSTNFLDAQLLLNEGTGSLANNQGCSPAGRVIGPVVWAHPGLQFNGNNNYVNCGPTAGNDVQTALTLAAWIQPARFIDWAGILTKGTNSATYAMQTWSDGTLRFTANWGGPPGGVGGGSWNSTTTLATNQWQHVAVTYDGIKVRFYINGVLDENQPAVSLRFGVVNEPLTIGADLPGGDEYFQGIIRDARVYGRALSGEEIQALVNQPPVITSTPGNFNLIAGTTLTVTNLATDSDLPAQTLTWSLLAPPAGAVIDPDDGIFSWRPAIAQSPSTNAINLQVTDNGTPPMSATQTFMVTVQRPQTPTFSSHGFSNGVFSLLINGDAGPDYIVETSTNLADGSFWLPATTNLSAIPPFYWTDPDPGALNQKFYRIRLAP
jgi:GH43 family beta-xylosidase